MSVFSERVDQVMQEKHYTNGMVAIKTGLSRITIHRYKRGYREPTAWNIFLIADALGVDPRWLIGMKEEKTHE